MDNAIVIQQDKPIRVLVSYSHDSPDHDDRVLQLSNRLRLDGIDSIIDQYEASPPQGWPRWMRDQLGQADYVLVICTETYMKRFYGHEEPGTGLGATWEGVIISQDLYNAGVRNTRFIPLVFRRQDRANIPDVLQGATYYVLDSDSGYTELYMRLRGLTPAVMPELGTLRPLSPLPRQEDFTASGRVPKSVQEYAKQAMLWAKGYMEVLPVLQAKMWPNARQLNDPQWREDVLDRAHILEAISTQVLSYDIVPPEAEQVHEVLKDIASHMNRSSILVRTAIHERNEALIEGESAAEMRIVAELATNDLNRELQKLVPRLVVPVRCDVSSFQNIVVHFRLDNLDEQTRNMQALQARLDTISLDEFLQFLANTLVQFDNWNIRDRRGIVVPAPHPRQPISYRPLVLEDQAAGLLRWALQEGWREAARQVDEQK